MEEETNLKLSMYVHNPMSNNETGTVFTPFALIPTVHIRSMSLSPSIPLLLCIITPFGKEEEKSRESSSPTM